MKTVALLAILVILLGFCSNALLFAEEWSETTFSDGEFNNTVTTTDNADVELYNTIIPPWTSLTNTPATVYSGGSLCSTGGDYIYGFRGNTSNGFWRYSIVSDTWTAMTNAPENVSAGGALSYPGTGDYIFAFRGVNTNAFWSYSISGNSWSSLTNAPANVSSGGALVSTGDDYIYALGGNSTTNFWRYTISGDSWTVMTDTLATISMGGSLTYPGSGDYIYASRGGYNTFWRYSISGNSWETRTSAPSPFYYGAASVSTNGDYIYALSGGTFSRFNCYSISGNSWTVLPNTPASASYGGALCYPGSGDYLYAFRGYNSISFWRYQIPADSWTTMTSASAAVYSGGALCSTNNDYIYAFRGASTSSFLRYSIISDTWTSMTNTPATVGWGGALAYPGSGDYIYALRGNSSNAFWRYTISGDSWTAMTNTPAAVTYGGSLCFTGGDYIYAFRGYSTDFWRYSISGDSWSAMTSVSGNISYGGSLCYPGTGDYIYAFRGGNGPYFYRYSISGNSWSIMTTALDNVYSGGALCYPGTGDNIYAFGGYYNASGVRFWRYSISGNSWTGMAIAPANVSSGGALCYPGSGNYIYALRGNFSANLWRYKCWSYRASGDYISDDIEVISPTFIYSWDVLTYTHDAPVSTTFTVDVLDSDNALIVSNVASGTNLSQTYPVQFNGVSGIKLRGNFSTTDDQVSPMLSDWSVTYQVYDYSDIVVLNSPANGAIETDVNITLQWYPVTGITYYKPYIGFSNPPSIFLGNTTNTYYWGPTLNPNTLHYWRVDSYKNGMIITGDVWSFTTIPMCGAPTLLSPGNSATNVPITSSINWQSVTYADSYEIYFGTSLVYLTEVMSPTTTYTPTMTAGNTYYWRIGAQNCVGVHFSSTWSFTTQPLPVQVTNPNPANYAENVLVSSSLSWNSANYADSYDIYLDTTSTGWTLITNTVITYYTPSPQLQYSTLYYWRIDSVNAVGTTTGNIWTFSTLFPPAQATGPEPDDDETDLELDTTLSWVSASDADKYDVYFGDYNPPGLVASNVNKELYRTEYTDISLAYSTTYYWRINAKNDAGTTQGVVWNFTTIADSPPVFTSITYQINGGDVVYLDPEDTIYIYENDVLIVQLVATDPDYNTITYSMEPDMTFYFASLDSETGEFNWTPDYAQADIYYVMFTATANGLFDTEMITIDVSDVYLNPPEIVTMTPTTDVLPGDEITITGTNFALEAYNNIVRFTFGEGVYVDIVASWVNGTGTELRVTIPNDLMDITDFDTGDGTINVTIQVIVYLVPCEQVNVPKMFSAIADIDMDANRDGTVDNTMADDQGENKWEYGSNKKGAIIIFNCDDDNSDSIVDAEDGIINGNDDISDLTPLVIRVPGATRSGTHGFLSVSDKSKIRIFNGDTTGASAVISPTGTTNEYEIPNYASLTSPLTYLIEATQYPDANFNGLIIITLTVSYTVGSGTGQMIDSLIVRVAPWLMLPSTAPPEKVYLTDHDETFIDDLRDLIGSELVSEPITNSNKVWTQDAFEIGYSKYVNSYTQVVFDTPYVNDFQGLDDYCENNLLGPNFGIIDYDGPNYSNGDAGGNLEVSPPILGYPFGRIMHGNYVSNKVEDFLSAQLIQSGFSVDTSWLAVGHVDEVCAFVPYGQNGFKIVMPDPGHNAMGYLQYLYDYTEDEGQTHPKREKPVFKGKIGETSVQAIIESKNPDYCGINDWVQGKLDSINNTLMDELNLGDGDIILVPVIFSATVNGDTWKDATAYSPNLANMLVLNNILVLPDPFGPEDDPDGEGPEGVQDLFKYIAKEQLKTYGGFQEDDIKFIDDWNTYHLDEGEVHCGTNVKRTPPTNIKWWEHQP